MAWICESEEKRLENMALLALGLYRLAEVDGELGFSMRTYLRDTATNRMFWDWEAEEIPARLEILKEALASGDECGTTACALGHGPLFGIGRLNNLSWVSYCACNFTGCGDAETFNWLFGGQWAGIPGHDDRKSAAKRLAWHVLKGHDSTYPSDVFKWDRWDEFLAWSPHWDAIEALVPVERLQGIEWISNIKRGPSREAPSSEQVTE